MHDPRGADHQFQTVVLFLQPLAHPLDLLDDRSGTDFQSRKIQEQPRDLPQRQPITHPHHHRGG
jgi:hypothetical protein